MDSDTATESNLSLKSRSLLHRVTVRVRKILDHSSKDAMQDIDKHFLIWWMFMSSTLEASISWQKLFIKFTFHQEHGTIPRWNRCLTYLKSWQSDNQMRLLECHQSTGKILHGNNYLWSSMKKSSVSRTQRFLCFQILCCALERCTRTHIQILFGKESWVGSKIHHSTELWTIDGEPAAKSKSSCLQWAINQKNFKDGSSSCRCPMTSYGDLKTMNGNALLTPHMCLYLQKYFHQDVGHSSDLDQKRSGILLVTADTEEKGTESLNSRWSNSEKADTQFSGPRVQCPEKRSKAKEVENYQCTSVPMGERLKLFFAQTFQWISAVSTEQSQICVMYTVLAKQERRDPWSSEISEEQLLIKPTKNPKPNKNESHDQERRDPCHSEIPEWLQEFRERTLWMTEFLTQRLTCKFFSWIIFRAYTCEKCGFG